MSQNSLTSFLDTLISEDTLTCIQCKSLLQSPIMLVKEGNMCGSCYNSLETKPKNCMENIALQRILNQLKFPCKFLWNGCRERIIYKELENHHNICEYNDKCCLMSDSTKCTWTGKQADFLNHFLQQHVELTINDENNSFLIVLNLTTNLNTYYLLKGKNDDTFLMKCVINMEMNSLGYTICHIDGDCFDKYRCTITHIGLNDSDVTARCTLKPYHVMYEQNHDLGVKVVLSALKEITEKPKCITIRIDIKSTYEEISEILLKTLECPICKNYMRTPIFQCNTGHSICSDCKSRITSCPTCRDQLGNKRNYALESLTINVHYPCIYHHLGCKKILLLNDIIRHENNCNFKSYNCPIDGCNFTGNFTIITNHLTSLHPNQLILSHYHRFTINVINNLFNNFSETQRYHFITLNNIFRLTFMKNHDDKFWAVEVLGNCQENDIFTYEIGIVASNTAHKKLIRIEECLKDVNRNDLFKKSVSFPNTLISSYIFNGSLIFYCQIHKQT